MEDSTLPAVPIQPLAGGLLRRAVALVIDGLVAMLAMLPLNLIFILRFGSRASSPLTPLTAEGATASLWGLGLWLASLGFTFLYYGWFYKHYGATPGKRLLGLKVVDTDSAEFLGYGRTFLRETVGKVLFGLSLVPLFLGLFIAAFRPDKRCVHDFIAHSRVIRAQ